MFHVLFKDERSSRDLFPAGDQYVIESDGLLVRSVQRGDAGTYTCRARVPQTGELEERDIRLDVQVKWKNMQKIPRRAD